MCVCETPAHEYVCISSCAHVCVRVGGVGGVGGEMLAGVAGGSGAPNQGSQQLL